MQTADLITSGGGGGGLECMLCRCCLYASALVLFDITLSQIFTTTITGGMWKVQPTLGSFTLSSVQLKKQQQQQLQQQ